MSGLRQAWVNLCRGGRWVPIWAALRPGGPIAVYLCQHFSLNLLARAYGPAAGSQECYEPKEDEGSKGAVHNRIVGATSDSYVCNSPQVELIKIT